MPKQLTLCAFLNILLLITCNSPYRAYTDIDGEWKGGSDSKFFVLEFTVENHRIMEYTVKYWRDEHYSSFSGRGSKIQNNRFSFSIAGVKVYGRFENNTKSKGNFVFFMHNGQWTAFKQE